MNKTLSLKYDRQRLIISILVNQSSIIDTKKPDTDIIEEITGAFGRYQLFLLLIFFVSKFITALHQMAIIFLAPKVSYTCPDTGKATCPCNNPIYDRSLFSRTIIMEWNLICERKHLASLVQTLFQLGTLLGSVFFGMASDRFGRKPTLLFAVVLQILSSTCAGYVPNYWIFTFLRFVIGTAIGGIMVVTFVLLMEFLGTKYRDSISSVYHLLFNIGHVMLPAFGYFFRDFSHFHLSISVPGIFMVTYFVLLSETPRWLIAVNRTEKAIIILEHVAKVNKRPTANIRTEVEAYQKILNADQLVKGTVVDIFRTPNMRKNILIMAFDWLACGYCFYGVSQYVGQLSGNPFTNVAAGATLTLLGTVASIGLLRISGRKTLTILFCFICSFCLFLLAALPEGIGSVVCASIGQVSIFIVFIVVYLYCSELFPTIVRNAAVGVCSMSARLGSMIAPFVVNLGGASRWVPPLAFATLPLIAGCITFLLPETKGIELMTTLEQGEQFGKKQRKNVLTMR